jgi:hypothetical protein
MYDDLLTVTQAAEYLGVTRQAVHVLTKRGYGRRLGSFWLFTRANSMRIVHCHAARRPPARSKNRNQRSESGSTGIDTRTSRGTGATLQGHTRTPYRPGQPELPEAVAL